jgi:integrase
VSGPRPPHLTRRDAVYVVRFRLPADLAKRTGVGELRRSLFTKDLAEARRRCLLASEWFGHAVEQLREMKTVSRSDLEGAARQFFGTLRDEVDQPRDFPDDHYDQELDFQLASTRDHIGKLDDQLRSNRYSPGVEWTANELVRLLGATLPDLTEQLRLVAMQLAARAEREQMQYLTHQLTSPATVFAPSDQLFLPGAPTSSPPAFHSPQITPVPSGKTLSEASAEYLRKKKIKGVGLSQITELERSLGWLQEVLGADRRLPTVTKDEMRTFRDDLERLEVSLRGRRAPFKDRLTNDPTKQIRSVTSTRYWKAVQSFFEWCTVELSLPSDPTLGLKIEKRKHETPESPEPFSEDELRKFLQTPVFAGYKPIKHYSTPGPCRKRGAQFWAGILPLYTGLRAGEFTQLLPTDFVFDHEIPHLKVQEVDGNGDKVKSTKNLASIRDVPLAADLLTLGLREYVERQAKRFPKERVFSYFRTGNQGRRSDGMSRFWLDYLKLFGLWKPGRATHVMRHTIIARLRALEVAEEDISAFVGHSGKTMTSRYGGAYPLARKAGTAAKLNYGFDLVEAVGGPYSDAIHRV